MTLGDKKIYIVAKAFDKPGCLAYLCKTPNKARCLPGTLEPLWADGVQIVILDSPEIYSELWALYLCGFSIKSRKFIQNSQTHWAATVSPLTT